MTTAAPASRPATASIADVFGNRNYSVFFVAAFISNAGTFMQTVGVPFVLFDITKSNTWVGVSVFATMIPSLVMGPVAGAFADRFSRKSILLWSNLVQGLSAAGLWWLAARDALTPWRIIGLLVMGGLATGFQSATAHALVSLLVPPEHLLAALRINTVGLNLARVLGPVTAGWVLSTWGYRSTFALNTISFGVVLVGLLFTRPSPQPRSAGGEAWYRSFADGVRYLRGHEALVEMILFSFIVSTFGASVWQLAAGLAAEGFHTSSDGLGWLVGAFGAGACVSAVVVVARGARLSRSSAALVGLVVYGLGILVAVSTPWLAIGLVGFAVFGVAHSLTTIASNTALQAQVAERYRGRALSLFVMSYLVGLPVGALIGGRLSDLIGVRITLAGYGAALLAYAALRVAQGRRFYVLDGDNVLEPVHSVAALADVAVPSAPTQ